MATDATPAEPPSGVSAPTGAGGIAARLDRLPVQPYHWPHHAFGSLDYSLLVGFSNGLGPLNHRNQEMWLLDAVTAKQKRRARGDIEVSLLDPSQPAMAHSISVAAAPGDTEPR